MHLRMVSNEEEEIVESLLEKVHFVKHSKMRQRQRKSPAYRISSDLAGVA